jgi:hypothetical protein
VFVILLSDFITIQEHVLLVAELYLRIATPLHAKVYVHGLMLLATMGAVISTALQITIKTILIMPALISAF